MHVFLIMLVKITLYSKLHCQKVLNRNTFQMKWTETEPDILVWSSSLRILGLGFRSSGCNLLLAVVMVHFRPRIVSKKLPWYACCVRREHVLGVDSVRSMIASVYG
jgi:hypothetical protein